MFRMKANFGDGVASRTPARQATEAGVRCRALNIMAHQGMPQSERKASPNPLCKLMGVVEPLPVAGMVEPRG
jgi:hypothetical protein